MGAIANNAQYERLTHNSKMSQTNYGLDNSMWSRSLNYTCNCCFNFNTKILQELDVHNAMGDVETYYYVGGCMLVRSQDSQRKASTIFQKNGDFGHSFYNQKVGVMLLVGS